MLQLNDKVAIVTGAGRGNGRGVAMALADHGAACHGMRYQRRKRKKCCKGNQ